MSIPRLFRRRALPSEHVDEVRQINESLAGLQIPLLELKSDECAANILQLEDTRASLALQIADLQEQLRQVNIALDAERERARIIAAGLESGKLVPAERITGPNSPAQQAVVTVADPEEGRAAD